MIFIRPIDFGAGDLLSCLMRYHSAIAITKPEADFLIRSPGTSLNAWAVVEVFGKWYDVRRMTLVELNDFLDHLQRAHNEDVTAGLLTPH